jgi:hypothetical protein
MSVGTHFDMAAFADALEEQRKARGLSWAEATREIRRGRESFAAMSTSSFKSMASKGSGNSAIVLQALLWLDRTPESFVVGRTRPPSEAERLPRPPEGHTLRFDSLIIHPALDAQREALGMTWREVAGALPRFNESVLRRLAEGQQRRSPWPRPPSSSISASPRWRSSSGMPASNRSSSAATTSSPSTSSPRSHADRSDPDDVERRRRNRSSSRPLLIPIRLGTLRTVVADQGESQVGRQVDG